MGETKQIHLSELTVIVISVLLVGSVLFGLVLKKNQARENDNRRKEVLVQIQDSLENYFENEGRYPDDLNGLVPSYLKEIPKNIDNTPWIYLPENNDQTYILKVELENASVADDNVAEDSGFLFYQLQSKQ